jgi:hypothetical protein
VNPSSGGRVCRFQCTVVWKAWRSSSTASDRAVWGSKIKGLGAPRTNGDGSRPGGDSGLQFRLTTIKGAQVLDPSAARARQCVKQSSRGSCPPVSGGVIRRGTVQRSPEAWWNFFLGYFVSISFPVEFDVWGRLCTHFEAAKVMTFTDGEKMVYEIWRRMEHSIAQTGM